MSLLTRTLLRVSLRSRTALQRYSTAAHEAPHAAGAAKSDLPWIIGSAAVFGPAIFYLTAPPSKSAHVEHHAPSAVEEEEEVVEEEVPAAEPEVKVEEVKEVKETKVEEAKEVKEVEKKEESVEEKAEKALKA